MRRKNGLVWGALGIAVSVFVSFFALQSAAFACSSYTPDYIIWPASPIGQLLPEEPILVPVNTRIVARCQDETNCKLKLVEKTSGEQVELKSEAVKRSSDGYSYFEISNSLKPNTEYQLTLGTAEGVRSFKTGAGKDDSPPDISGSTVDVSLRWAANGLEVEATPAGICDRVEYGMDSVPADAANVGKPLPEHFHLTLLVQGIPLNDAYFYTLNVSEIGDDGKEKGAGSYANGIADLGRISVSDVGPTKTYRIRIEDTAGNVQDKPLEPVVNFGEYLQKARLYFNDPDPGHQAAPPENPSSGSSSGCSLIIN